MIESQKSWCAGRSPLLPLQLAGKNYLERFLNGSFARVQIPDFPIYVTRILLFPVQLNCRFHCSTGSQNDSPFHVHRPEIAGTCSTGGVALTRFASANQRSKVRSAIDYCLQPFKLYAALFVTLISYVLNDCSAYRKSTCTFVPIHIHNMEI